MSFHVHRAVNGPLAFCFHLDATAGIEPATLLGYISYALNKVRCSTTVTCHVVSVFHPFCVSVSVFYPFLRTYFVSPLCKSFFNFVTWYPCLYICQCCEFFFFLKAIKSNVGVCGARLSVRVCGARPWRWDPSAVAPQNTYILPFREGKLYL